jgi:HK97 family phage portal protein
MSSFRHSPSLKLPPVVRSRPQNRDMGRIADFLTGKNLIESNGSESRTIMPGTTQEAWTPITRTALPPVNEQTALRIGDVFAAVRLLSDAVAALPLKVYRDTPRGRVPAGDDQRLVTLLRRPSPGTTSVDLVGQLMTHLLTFGNSYLAKYKSDREITMLGLIDPASVVVEVVGARVIYKLSRREGFSEHGPEDIVHIKALSSDGVSGMSTVRQAAKVLQLSEGLTTYITSWLGNDARPSGVLSLSGDAQVNRDTLSGLKTDMTELYGWEREPPAHGSVAVMTGDLSYSPVDPSLRDQEFVAQREHSAREVCRIFNVPGWLLGVATGDSLTYSNATETMRAFHTHSLRPWLTRIEKALSADPDLCPGGTYAEFELSGLLRGDDRTRAEVYEKALASGWLTLAEVRELENRPPLEGT